MPEPVATSRGHGRYRFGVFEFDADTLELSKHARPVATARSSATETGAAGHDRAAGRRDRDRVGR